MSQKQFKHCLAFCLVLSRFPGGRMALYWLIIQKTLRFVSCSDAVEKHPIFVSTVDQETVSVHAIITLVLCLDAWNTVLGHQTEFCGKYRGQSLLLLLLRLPSTIWERLAFNNIANCWNLSEFWPFLVAQYGHHVPNCLSPRLLHRTLA
jgi:hypothetical protein